MQSCHVWLDLLALLGGGNSFGSRTVFDVKVARRQRKKNPYSSSIKTKNYTEIGVEMLILIHLKCKAKRLILSDLKFDFTQITDQKYRKHP